MIKTRIINDRQEIEKFMPRCMELARNADCKIPFQYFQVPLIWWDHFFSQKRETFAKTRGTNFLGYQSNLYELCLVLIEDGSDRLLGATLFSGYTVMLPRMKVPLRVLTWPGDYQLIAFHDFVILPEGKDERIYRLIESFINIGSQYDLMILNSLPENSTNLTHIRRYISELCNKNIAAKEMITGRRGGVRPWTMGSLIQCLYKLAEIIPPDPNIKNDVLCLIDEMNKCSPFKLFFPASREKLKNKLLSIIEALKDIDKVSDLKKTINFLLSDQPTIYPYIKLPKDRETYFMTLSRSTRRYFRRYRKMFKKMGGIFEKISAADISSKDIDDYLNLHSMRWKGTSASLSNEQTYKFHHALCKNLAKRGEFTLFFAKYEGQRIATHSCIDILDRREGYMIGRDEKFNHLRIGRILYMETILDAIDNRYDIYELGEGWVDYKMKFTKTYSHALNIFLSWKSNLAEIENLYLGYEYMADKDDRLQHLPT